MSGPCYGGCRALILSNSALWFLESRRRTKRSVNRQNAPKMTKVRALPAAWMRERNVNDTRKFDVPKLNVDAATPRPRTRRGKTSETRIHAIGPDTKGIASDERHQTRGGDLTQRLPQRRLIVEAIQPASTATAVMPPMPCVKKRFSPLRDPPEQERSLWPAHSSWLPEMSRRLRFCLELMPASENICGP